MILVPVLVLVVFLSKIYGIAGLPIYAQVGLPTLTLVPKKRAYPLTS